MFDMWSIVTLLFFFEVLILVNSQTCRVCDQFISGRNLPYERALAIIQDEEYLDDSDFDEIRYKRRYDSQSYNEVFHRWHSRVKRAEGRKIDLGFSHEFFEFFGCLTPDDQCITSRSELDSALSTRFSQGEKDSFCDFQEDLDLQLVCHTPIGYVFRPYPNLTGSGELLITNCDEERSYAAQLIEYISNAFSCPSPIEEFMEMVMDFVEENAPTTAATLTTTLAPTTTSTTTTTTPTTTTPVPTALPITSATVPPITSATVSPITTTVPPTTLSITVPQTLNSAQVSDEPENQLVHQRIVPFGVEDAMVIKPVELREESTLQPGQSTSDILNNIDDSDSDENENDIENVIDDIRVTSEIVPIYVRPVLNQAFYNPTYYRDEK